MKIWNKFFKCLSTFKAHDDPIYALSINKTGVYLSTGGKDCKVKIWKVTDLEKPIKEYESDSVVNDCAFNPKFQWIAAASEKSVSIWDISQEKSQPIVNFKLDKKDKYKFTSIAWDSQGTHLFAGCNDGNIRVYSIDVQN